jgi:hypothetical protein
VRRSLLPVIIVMAICLLLSAFLLYSANLPE